MLLSFYRSIAVLARNDLQNMYGTLYSTNEDVTLKTTDEHQGVHRQEVEIYLDEKKVQAIQQARLFFFKKRV